MKKVIFIGGPYGVGKTTVSHFLVNSCDKTVMLDGEWCWYQGNDWNFEPNIKEMAIDNICYVLCNFLKNPYFDNIVFSWVLHKPSDHQTIIDALNRTNVDYELYDISLVCSEEVLLKRLENRMLEKANEFDAYYKKEDLLVTFNGSVKKLRQIEKLKTYKIDVSNLSKEQVQEKVAEYVGLNLKKDKIYIKH